MTRRAAAHGSLVVSAVVLAALVVWTVTGGLDAFTARAFHGASLPILNIPHDQPLVSGIGELEAYQRIAHRAALATGGLLLFLMAIATASLAGMRAPGAWLQTPFVDKPPVYVLYVASTLTGLAIIRMGGYEGAWYPLDAAVSFTADPPFLHRVLLPLVARQLISIVPQLTVYQAFLITQIAILGLLFPALRAWCALFVSSGVAAIAACLVIPMLALSVSYYTFYDLAIILSYTVGLLLLWQRKTVAYLVLMILATLNHENILLLIILSGALHQPFRPGKSFDWRFVALGVMVYSVTRLALFLALPVDRAAQFGNLWINLHLLLEPSFILFKTGVLFLWFAVGFFALPFAPPFLRKTTLILPMLLIVTLIFGLLHEARQFVAFIPISIALLALMVQVAQSRLFANERAA